MNNLINPIASNKVSFNGYLVYSRADRLAKMFDEINEISDLYDKSKKSFTPNMIQVGFDEWKPAEDIALEREKDMITELNTFRKLDNAFTKVINSIIGTSKGNNAAIKIVESIKKEEENPGFLQNKFPFAKFGKNINSIKIEDFKKLAEYFIKQDIKTDF